MKKSTLIEVENLDHLGIIAGIIDELGIVEIVNQRIGIEAQEKINAGQIVKAIIINGLGFVSKPLYLFHQFFKDKAVEQLLGEGITHEVINDDKIGRVMDKLFCNDLSEIFVSIALNAVKKYQISTKQSHLDASSLSLSGQYSNQPETLVNNSGEEPVHQPIQIVKGYSRDHRPDLKQFVINLICSNDGDIPLYFEGGDGNQSDKAKFTAIAKRFKEQVNFDSILVADSALYSLENIKGLGETPWLSRVPLSVKAAKELVNQIPTDELVKSELEGYTWCVKESNYGGIVQRWLVVESAARKESDKVKLEKNIEKEYREITKKLKQLSHSKFDHQSCLYQSLKSLEKNLKYHQLSEIEIKEINSNSRSKTDKQASESIQYQVSGTLVKDGSAIELCQRRAGRFILATNILEDGVLTPDEILSKYKEQQCTERGFRFLKDPLFFADSVFLKSPERIETMAMLMGLCLLVYTIGQRQLRAALKQCNTGIKNQLGKLTNTPTLRWIFQCFQGIHYVKLNGEEEVVNLTDDRWWILSFFPDACQSYYLL